MSGERLDAREIVVELPRFRIVSLILVVAIAALDFGAIRAMIELESVRGELLVLGALPMANLMAFGLMIRRRRPGGHPFLLGFMAFGAIALACDIAVANLFPREAVMHSVRPLTEYLVKTVGLDRPIVFVSVQCTAGVFMLGLPQLTFALMGGLLARTYRNSVPKRPD